MKYFIYLLLIFFFLEWSSFADDQKKENNSLKESESPAGNDSSTEKLEIKQTESKSIKIESNEEILKKNADSSQASTEKIDTPTNSLSSKEKEEIAERNCASMNTEINCKAKSMFCTWSLEKKECIDITLPFSKIKFIDSNPKDSIKSDSPAKYRDMEGSFIIRNPKPFRNIREEKQQEPKKE